MNSLKSQELTPNSKYLNRRDFMKAAGVLAGSALLAACAPRTGEAPAITPMPTTTGLEPTPIPTHPFIETPLPQETETVYPLATIEGLTKRDLAVDVANYERSDVYWYNENKELVSALGAESGLTLVGGFVVRDKDGKELPNGHFGIVTWQGGESFFANRLIDGRWVVLTYGELMRGSDKHTFKSFVYSSGNIIRPILSVEVDESGKEVGNNFYYELADDTFYKLDNQLPDKGLDGLAMVAMAKNAHILSGQTLMQNSAYGDQWNFSWSDKGILQIVTTDGEVIYDHWDAAKNEWVKVESLIDPGSTHKEYTLSNGEVVVVPEFFVDPNITDKRLAAEKVLKDILKFEIANFDIAWGYGEKDITYASDWLHKSWWGQYIWQNPFVQVRTEADGPVKKLQISLRDTPDGMLVVNVRKNSEGKYQFVFALTNADSSELLNLIKNGEDGKEVIDLSQ